MSLNPILLEVLWNRLLSVANEQQVALMRTAFSSIVRESQDLACGVFDARGQMIAQSLTSATRALYTRADLDLLLSSPVSVRSVLASRAFVIVTETVGSVLIFLAPLINMCALMGYTHWLAVYPTNGSTRLK